MTAARRTWAWRHSRLGGEGTLREGGREPAGSLSCFLKPDLSQPEKLPQTHQLGLGGQARGVCASHYARRSAASIYKTPASFRSWPVFISVTGSQPRNALGIDG